MPNSTSFLRVGVLEFDKRKFAWKNQKFPAVKAKKSSSRCKVGMRRVERFEYKESVKGTYRASSNGRKEKVEVDLEPSVYSVCSEVFVFVFRSRARLCEFDQTYVASASASAS